MKSPEDAPRKPKGLSIWILGLINALGAIVVVSWAVLRLGSTEPDQPSPSTAAPEEISNLMETATAEQVRAATESTVRGFMEATSDEERSHFILGGENADEMLANFHRRAESPAPRGLGEFIDVRYAAFGGLPMQTVIVSEADRRTRRQFNLFPTKDRMLIDWESSVAYGEMPWPQFLDSRPTKPIQMRVYLKRVPDHDSRMVFEQTHKVYEVSAAAQPDKILGYAPVESPLANQLDAVVPHGASQPVNVRLQWTAGEPELRSLQIVELLHNFWVDPGRLRQQAP